MAKKIPSILLVLSGLLVPTQSTRAESNWEYWTGYGFTDSISDNITINVVPELRYQGGFSDHYYTHIDMGLDWKINDWLVLGPYYRHVEEKKDDQWNVEYRPHFNVTLKANLLGLSVSDRNRLEYRIKDDEDFFRYRNKLTLKLQKATLFEVQPYVADEPFYDFDANEIDKNRDYAGFGFTIFNKLKADINYILESRKKADHWVDVNVLALSLRYSF
jgi:hypothetical protein